MFNPRFLNAVGLGSFGSSGATKPIGCITHVILYSVFSFKPLANTNVCFAFSTQSADCADPMIPVMDVTAFARSIEL